MMLVQSGRRGNESLLRLVLVSSFSMLAHPRSVA